MKNIRVDGKLTKVQDYLNAVCKDKLENSIP
ncbi:hypothetical protein GGR10_000144 [Bartonella chomelii]|uniref:Uncharacterized protein n=1 Tax=Bartonella chomelii TaxID=236402 RepID=A0ABR6E2H0_9HYPH|nr:hypothetical protein [Bartonella chomelii]